MLPEPGTTTRLHDVVRAIEVGSYIEISRRHILELIFAVVVGRNGSS